MKSILRETYKDKRIFLTGHTGFKGSWLLFWLHSLGGIVRGYALEPDSEQALYYDISGDSLCESIIGDLREKDSLRQAILEFEPDFIFHLAAQPLVRLSYEVPIDTFSINALGTAHVLDALRSLKKPCVGVMITTDKVYQNREWIYPYREYEALGGYDPYSASKACAELIITCYRNSFFNPSQYSSHKKSIASARAGNVIGGGDWAKDRLVPDIVKSLQRNMSIEIRNPRAVRPWQYVLEPLAGYMLLAAKMAEDPVKYADAFNFGPRAEDHISVESFVQKAIKSWGAGTYDTLTSTEQLHEADLLKLDISKSLSVLGWRPTLNADRAIDLTIQWYRSRIAGSNARDLVSSSVEQFSSRMTL